MSPKGQQPIIPPLKYHYQINTPEQKFNSTHSSHAVPPCMDLSPIFKYRRKHLTVKHLLDSLPEEAGISRKLFK